MPPIPARSTPLSESRNDKSATNDRRPTTDDPRLTTHDSQLTTHDSRLTTMKLTTLLAATTLAIGLTGPLAPLHAQDVTAADSAAIRQAALDYIDGYYTGDAARMTRALHPDLVKRIVRQHEGRSVLAEMTAQELIDGTAAGWGTRIPAEARRSEVTILDAVRNVASVRVDAHAWIDYMQIARVDGEWKIVNVLWEMRD